MVEHALACKVEGPVHIWHDDVVDEWRHLCALAFSLGRVEREPSIHSSIGCLVREVGDTHEVKPAQRGIKQPTVERGDVGCHGFWQRGRYTIFNIRIMDTDSLSAWNQDYSKVIAAQEKEKKEKYLDSCL